MITVYTDDKMIYKGDVYNNKTPIKGHMIYRNLNKCGDLESGHFKGSIFDSLSQTNRDADLKTKGVL